MPDYKYERCKCVDTTEIKEDRDKGMFDGYINDTFQDSAYSAKEPGFREL